ncbi:hypothetical protein ANO14919_007430 [Xylariales sp. No.14919]|nr:hypothetical protein ANO14919_007430 [Xylariales sp. No.14919]
MVEPVAEILRLRTASSFWLGPHQGANNPSDWVDRYFAAKMMASGELRAASCNKGLSFQELKTGIY